MKVIYNFSIAEIRPKEKRKPRPHKRSGFSLLLNYLTATTVTVTVATTECASETLTV
jgi:hypothetical protein